LSITVTFFFLVVMGFELRASIRQGLYHLPTLMVTFN
jgi:hypothetical protein